MPQAPRDSVLSSLTMMVSDEQEAAEDRLAAAALVLESTVPTPTAQEQDAAVSRFAEQVAEVVIQRITTTEEPA